jgi:hypothetical protein
VSDEARPEHLHAAPDHVGGGRSPESDDELVAEGLRALRAEGPSEASRQQLLLELGLDAEPRRLSRSPLREPFGSISQGLALGLALGLVLVVLRVLIR